MVLQGYNLEVEQKIVNYLFKNHHNPNATSIREISRQLNLPYNQVRDVIYKLEAENVVSIIRLAQQYIVRLKDISKAIEKNYLSFSKVIRNIGYIVPLPVRVSSFYLSDELFLTLPFKTRLIPETYLILVSDIKSRTKMKNQYLAYLGELPRLTLLFYRVLATPIPNEFRKFYEEYLVRLGNYEILNVMPLSYGFFSFLAYIVEKFYGNIEPEKVYLEILKLIKEYIERTRAEPNDMELFIEQILDDMIYGASKI